LSPSRAAERPEEARPLGSGDSYREDPAHNTSGASERSKGPRPSPWTSCRADRPCAPRRSLRLRQGPRPPRARRDPPAAGSPLLRLPRAVSAPAPGPARPRVDDRSFSGGFRQVREVASCYSTRRRGQEAPQWAPTWPFPSRSWRTSPPTAGDRERPVVDPMREGEAAAAPALAPDEAEVDRVTRGAKSGCAVPPTCVKVPAPSEGSESVAQTVLVKSTVGPA
jgi:hypothetical protein